MDDLNPYDELGVARDADERAIRQAYRKASKKAHPDAGGDAEAFARLSTSLAVLTDPAKRKTFDDTGRIEQDRPDNDRAAALQVVDAHMGALINAYVGSFEAKNDPRHFDVLASIKSKVLMEIVQAKTAIAAGEKIGKLFRDLATRFKRRNPDAPGDNVMTRGFEQQLRHNEEQIAGLRQNIRIRELALTIVDEHEFRHDPPPPRDEGDYSYGEREFRMDLGGTIFKATGRGV